MGQASRVAKHACLLLGPLLGGRVEEVVAPEALAELQGVDAELHGIDVGERGQGESPAVESGREAHSANLGAHLNAKEPLNSCRGIHGVGERGKQRNKVVVLVQSLIKCAEY